MAVSGARVRLAAHHPDGDALPEGRLPRLPGRGAQYRAEQASLLARTSASSEALILRNHGALVVGRTVGEAFNWMHRLELACQTRSWPPWPATRRLAKVPQPVLDETWNNYQPATRVGPMVVMEWPALLRKLDRLDPRLSRLTP
jgi:hypothetical protein